MAQTGTKIAHCVRPRTAKKKGRKQVLSKSQIQMASSSSDIVAQPLIGLPWGSLSANYRSRRRDYVGCGIPTTWAPKLERVVPKDRAAWSRLNIQTSETNRGEDFEKSRNHRLQKNSEAEPVQFFSDAVRGTRKLSTFPRALEQNAILFRTPFLKCRLSVRLSSP